MNDFDIIEVETWKRRSTFNFFRDFDDPFFNISANLDVTNLHEACKATGLSFSLASLFLSTQAANEIEAFRLRLVGGEVRRYSLVHCGATLLHDDETFSFCYFDMQPDVHQFIAEGRRRIAEQHLRRSFDPRDDEHGVLHYSVVPWVSFLGVKHPRRFGREDSVPKIVFGKKFGQLGRWLMPVSLEAHHALMDGLHAGRYFELFQKKLDDFGQS